MNDAQDEPATGVAAVVAHPQDAAGELADEVKRGRSWRTPFLALGGTALMVAALVIVVAAVVFAAYYLAK